MTDLTPLKTLFNDRFRAVPKREGVTQLIVPLYHEDGDLVDIFLEQLPDGTLRISDHGMTLMRLSYSFELDSEHKERIFQSILAEHGLLESDGNIYTNTTSDDLYPSILRFGQAVAQISSMRRYRREVVQNLFFESLVDTIYKKFAKFHPQFDVYPLSGQEEYKVDAVFNDRPRPVYLFGVNNDSTAKLATISLQRFLIKELVFVGAVVLESLDSMPKRDQVRLMSAADKLFPSLSDFAEYGERYLQRELESSSN